MQVRDYPYSIYVDGSNGDPGNALSAANSASLNPTAAVTFRSWFMPVGTPKAFVLMDNSDAGATLAPTIIIGSGGSVSWYSTVNGVARNVVNATSRLVRWGRPNMLDATFTGSAIRLFLNGGQLTEEITGLSGSIGTNTGTFRIGAYVSGGAGLTFQGYLSRQWLFASGVTLSDHLAGYYDDSMSTTLQASTRLAALMSEGSGSTTADSSGNGNTLTLGASASWSTVTPFRPRTQVASPRTQTSVGRTQVSSPRTQVS